MDYLCITLHPRVFLLICRRPSISRMLTMLTITLGTYKSNSGNCVKHTVSKWPGLYFAVSKSLPPRRGDPGLSPCVARTSEVTGSPGVGEQMENVHLFLAFVHRFKTVFLTPNQKLWKWIQRGTIRIISISSSRLNCKCICSTALICAISPRSG